MCIRDSPGCAHTVPCPCGPDLDSQKPYRARCVAQTQPETSPTKTTQGPKKSLGVLCGDATEMTYFEFIEAQCANTDGPAAGRTKALMFRNLPVSSAGFYAWRKRMTGQEPSAATQRRADLLVKIASIHKDSDGAYGSPRSYGTRASW